MKPRSSTRLVIASIATILSMLLSACSLTSSQTASAPSPAAPNQNQSTTIPVSPSTTTPASEPSGSSTPQISPERLTGFLKDLTAIQPYSGWRTSGTQGEAQALEYAASKLQNLEFINAGGLEIERQEFQIFLSTDFWESRVELTIDGKTVEIPASAMRGSREDVRAALHFDSDGQLNDTDPNPVDVTGQVLFINDSAEIARLSESEAAGKVVIAGYDLFDRVINKDAAYRNAQTLLEKKPAALLLITQFSNQPGESHGTYAGEGGVFTDVDFTGPLPILFARLEDCATLGVSAVSDLERVESAHLVWDTDTVSPGTSGNLIVTIPGIDRSRALILGAHIDSANSPGAMDDGSGSAILLEVAAAIDAARVKPPYDLVLTWFGSEEAGLYGSMHFAATHQDLIDRSIGMLGVDCLTRPLDGISANLELNTWPIPEFSFGGSPWSAQIQQTAEDQGIQTVSVTPYSLASDNASFSGYDLPNVDLVYEDEKAMDPYGGVWYAGHIHDPYDTVELTGDVSGVLVDMARITLSTAFNRAAPEDSYRLTPPQKSRAVFVASHTEPSHMTPGGMLLPGIELASQGFDVDLVPYGQPVASQELQGAGLVFVLPVIDYSDAGAGEAWSAAEIDALKAYVDGGGLLVVANSAHRLKFFNSQYDDNEDRLVMNTLTQAWGIQFTDGDFQEQAVTVVGDHPISAGIYALIPAPGNGVPFTIADGQVLASINGQPFVAIVHPQGAKGEVLVLADLGLLNTDGKSMQNSELWKNLAVYALAR